MLISVDMRKVDPMNPLETTLSQWAGFKSSYNPLSRVDVLQQTLQEMLWHPLPIQTVNGVDGRAIITLLLPPSCHTHLSSVRDTPKHSQ